VRRVGLTTPPPSWKEFTALLEELFPGEYHPELRRFYLSEGSGPYFKDSPGPIPQYFYQTPTADADGNEISQIDSNQLLQPFHQGVSRCLEKLCKGGKIIPSLVPQWLRMVVKMNQVADGDVELDVDIDQLALRLHERALEKLQKGRHLAGKKLLEALLELNPTNPLALYNLACAQALLGEVQAMATLENAVDSGYKNFGHMQQDDDLVSLRHLNEFQLLIQRNTKQELVQDSQENRVPDANGQEEQQGNVDNVIQQPDVPPVEDSDDEPEYIELEPKTDQQFDLEPSMLRPYSSEIKLLMEMGFHDPEENCRLLEQCNGDIESVTQILLNL